MRPRSIVLALTLTPGCFQLDPLPAATDGGTGEVTSNGSTATSSGTITSSSTGSTDTGPTTETTGPTTTGPSSSTGPGTDTMGGCPSVYNIHDRACFLEEPFNVLLAAPRRLHAGPFPQGGNTGLTLVSGAAGDPAALQLFIDPLFNPNMTQAAMAMYPAAASTVGALGGPGTWEFVIVGQDGLDAVIERLNSDNPQTIMTGGCGVPKALALGEGPPAEAPIYLACLGGIVGSTGIYFSERAGDTFGAAVPMNNTDMLEGVELMAVGDLNGDAIEEVIVAGSLGGSGRLYLITQTQPGTTNNLSFLDLGAGEMFTDLAIRSLGDGGKVELLALVDKAGPLKSGFQVYVMEMGALKLIHEVSDGPNDPSAFGLGDFDADGKLDVAVTQFGGVVSDSEWGVWLQRENPADWEPYLGFPVGMPQDDLKSIDLVTGDFHPAGPTDIAILTDERVVVLSAQPPQP